MGKTFWNFTLVLAVCLFPCCMVLCTLLALKRSLGRVGRPQPLASACPPSRVAVLIPAYNVVHTIEGVLLRCLADPMVTLIVVVDGGSTDGSLDVALALAAKAAGRIVVQPAGPGITGRGNCMNLAAHVAMQELQAMRAGGASSSIQADASSGIDPDTAPALFFLHGDTTPPHNFGKLLSSALLDRSVAVGAFSIYTAGMRDGPTLLGRLGSLVANFLNNLRSRWMEAPYGDQGLFCRWEVFAAVGGFSEPLMEDSAFVWKARAFGTVSTLAPCCSTSAGQWHTLGLVFMMRNYLLLVAWAIGAVSPASIHRVYYPNRALPPSLSYADLSKACR